MPLVSGDRLGPYEVEHLLGAGGMGEVYRGVDTRLGRAVALKVISRRLVGDEGSRRRFETEARAASALNHPAIVTIYDIGEGDGLSWIAMELVEGRTLREAIADGPMSGRQALSIARQLAEGLAAAHAKGIVHRDLKPENVMLTHEGGVKILDFGVARQAPPTSEKGFVPRHCHGRRHGRRDHSRNRRLHVPRAGDGTEHRLQIRTSSRSARSFTSCSRASARSSVRPPSKHCLPSSVTSRRRCPPLAPVPPTHCNE